MHLGHVARSLALKDAPRMVSKGGGPKGSKEGNGKAGSNDGGRERNGGEKRKSRLAFDGADDDGSGGGRTGDVEPSSAIGDDEQGRYVALLGDAMGGKRGRAPPSSDAPDRGGRGGNKRAKTGGDARRLMMENAARVQAQEFM